MIKCYANSGKLRGFKIKIYPTESQKEIMNTYFNLYRYAYNWAIATEEENYKKYMQTKENNHMDENGNKIIKFISLFDLFSLFINHRNDTEWLQAMPLHTAKESIKNAYTAYMEFFSKRARHPKFKSKKTAKKVFSVRNEAKAFYFDGKYVKISGFPLGEMILCKTHNIPTGDNIRYYNITISSDGYEYWLSLNTEIDKSYLKEHKETGLETSTIGIDVGFRKFAVLSTGQVYYTPKTDYLEKRSRRQQSRLAKMSHRRYKESIRTKTKFEDIPLTKNEEKLKKKYCDTRKRLRNIKYSFIHQVSTEIANMYPKKIIMEDLRIESLKKNHFIASKVATNPSLYLLRFQLEYKCKDRGIEFELASPFYPSTQLCSRCGNRHKVWTSEIYRCPYCGLEIDRDLNAAINLSHYCG